MSMTLRETINRNPKQASIIAASLIGVALLFIIWYNCTGTAAGSGKSYYSIDDGQTFFEDDSKKIPPFKHEGKDAVRAHVFTCDGGATKFVGYLEMYNPQDKKLMEDALAGKAPPAAYAGFSGQAMVKKPGPQFQWIALMPGTTQFYAQTVQVTCPDGKTPERVYPE